MRLTLATDLSLRVLLYLAVHDDELVTVQRISAAHDVPRDHLAKIVHKLGRTGFVDTLRGRNGGLRLAMAPAHVRLGAVVRAIEPDFNVVECFDAANDCCMLSAVCALKHLLHTATAAYLRELDEITLADLLERSSATRAACSCGSPEKLDRA